MEENNEIKNEEAPVKEENVVVNENKVEEKNSSPNGFAVVSLIMGIITLFDWILPIFAYITGVFGIVFGASSRKLQKLVCQL